MAPDPESRCNLDPCFWIPGSRFRAPRNDDGEVRVRPDGWSLRSAGRLAAARGVDLFFQRGKADGADHDVVADDIARRAVQAELLGELETLFQTAVDFC